MSTNAARRFTLEEYIAIEEASEIKHEFRDGQIVAMAGASPSHTFILAAYDRGDKFHDYRTLPSLTDYVLVAQDRAYLEHYQRQGESALWLYQAAEGLDATLLIGGLNLALPLMDVYAQVDGIA
jgi:Uma2 family endonuclease